MVRTFTLTQDGAFSESGGLEAARRAASAAPHRLWIDLEDPSDADLDALEEQFRFHPAALREVRERSTIPRIDSFGEFGFLVLHRVFYRFEDESCELRDFEIFFSRDIIVTIHRSHLARAFSAVADLVRKDPVQMLGEETSPVLLHLLDALVSDYLPVLEDWQEHIEEVEQTVLRGSTGDVIDRILKFKKLVSVLRRNLLPQKMVLTQLHERARSLHISEANRPYFKSVVDEMAALLREVEGLSALAASVFEIYATRLTLEMTRTSHSTNVVMQRLNLLAAIFMPLTFIVGVYGMNLPGIPETRWAGFYFVLWGLMAALVVSMLVFFKWRKWY